EHLVEHYAVTENVAPAIYPLTLHLLRRHIRHGSNYRPCLGGPACRLGFTLNDSFLAHDFGQSEVEHLHLPSRTEHDVLRLDVAVNDPARMRFPQSIGDLSRNRE